MPRYAVKISETQTRTKTIYVNAATAKEAEDIAHDSLSESFVKTLQQMPACISYSCHSVHGVRNVQPSLNEMLSEITTDAKNH